MKDLKEMSNDELIRMVLSLQQDNEKKDAVIAEKDGVIAKKDKELAKKDEKIAKKNEKIAKLEALIRKKNERLNVLIAKYEAKVQTNKKMIYDTYAEKGESLPKISKAINEVEGIKAEENQKKETQSEEKQKKETQGKSNKRRLTLTELFLKDLQGLYKETLTIDYDFEKNNIDRNSVCRFGEDVTYKLNAQFINFTLIKIIRPKYRDKNYIYQGKYDDPFPKSPLTPSWAANILVMKYLMGIPLYRYSEHLNSLGIEISPADLSNYVERALGKLEPLYNELEKAIRHPGVPVIHGDETPLKVIDSEKTNCYMFVYTTSYWDNPVYIYKFSETRKIDNAVELLDKYDGYFICDGYTGYDKLPKTVHGKIKIQRCWVHLRRYFTDVLKPLNNDLAKKSPAYNVVQKIDKLFKIEADMHAMTFSADQILAKRNSPQYKELLDDIDKTILDINPGSNSLLKKAKNHYVNDKAEMYTFLESGYLDVCNNLAERTVKPFVMGRKNFLFCKTENGATITGKAYSVVQTARANGLVADKYLEYVLENISKCPLENLLPWSMKLPQSVRI